MILNKETEYPKKKREVYRNFFDSRRWDNFELRKDDIIVATWQKSGTTWAQQICAQLIFNGSEESNVHELSPWLDGRIFPFDMVKAGLEAQTHRRFIKTHLPADALDISPDVRYLFIGRDGRDTLWSAYTHFAFLKDDIAGLLNEGREPDWPVFQKPAGSAHDFYKEWMDNDCEAFYSWFDHIKSWWDIRHLPNVKLVHFNNLKKDLKGQILEIASFLDIPREGLNIDTIVEHCSFDYMKKNAARFSPGGGVFWEGGADTFIYKGTNGRWKDVLSLQEVQEFDEIAEQRLGPQCAAWIATGEELQS